MQCLTWKNGIDNDNGHDNGVTLSPGLFLFRRRRKGILFLPRPWGIIQFPLSSSWSSSIEIRATCQFLGLQWLFLSTPILGSYRNPCHAMVSFHTFHWWTMLENKDEEKNETPSSPWCLTMTMSCACNFDHVSFFFTFHSFHWHSTFCPSPSVGFHVLPKVIGSAGPDLRTPILPTDNRKQPLSESTCYINQGSICRGPRGEPESFSSFFVCVRLCPICHNAVVGISWLGHYQIDWMSKLVYYRSSIFFRTTATCAICSPILVYMLSSAFLQ